MLSTCFVDDLTASTSKLVQTPQPDLYWVLSLRLADGRPGWLNGALSTTAIVLR